MPNPTTHLLVIGEREALAWILREERMAFPGGRLRMLRGLSEGDSLLLMTTRGCYHNPGRDRTRVIGEARLDSSIAFLESPVEIAGRSFEYGCDITIKSLVPRGEGVELGPLVEDLDAFPIKHAWSAMLRRPFVTLTDRDASTLRDGLTPDVVDPSESKASYLDTIRPVEFQRHQRRPS